MSTMTAGRIAFARTAFWALRAHASVRRQLAATGVDPFPSFPAPPAAPDAERAVNGVLRRRAATCLERSVVRQRWLAAHGLRRELLIGVTGVGDDLGAHAWLEGEMPTAALEEFTELLRRPAPEGP